MQFVSLVSAGKMIDYVKCLECGTEKTREDTFLDIPLPVRPFGSNVAYNSVVSTWSCMNLENKLFTTCKRVNKSGTFAGGSAQSVCPVRNIGRSQSVPLREMQQKMRRP